MCANKKTLHESEVAFQFLDLAAQTGPSTIFLKKM